jgi:hypothetical protein
MVDRLTPSNRAMLETLLLGRVSRSRDWRICAGHRRGPAQALAPGAGGVQALAGALDDQLADELGQGREHVEDQPAARSGGVQRLVQGPEPDPAAAQSGDDGDQVLQGP